MNRSLTRWLGALAVAVACGSAAAAHPQPSASWNGTWVEIPAKTDVFVPETFSLTSRADGTYRYASSSGRRYAFRCDGRADVGRSARRVACTARGSALLVMAYVGGPYVGSRWRLSNDGATLTKRSFDVAPDGERPTDTDVFERIGAGRGFAGVWKKVHAEEAPTIYRLAIEGDRFTVHVPNGSLDIRAVLDGSPAALVGPRFPADARNEYRVIGSHVLQELSLDAAGRPVEESLITLGPDGRSFVEVHRRLGSAERPIHIFFAKQRPSHA